MVKKGKIGKNVTYFNYFWHFYDMKGGGRGNILGEEHNIFGPDSFKYVNHVAKKYKCTVG